MQTIIELNSDDIVKIIAEHYKVNIDNVIIGIERTSVGYGMAEHDEYFPSASVRVDCRK